MSGIAFQGEPCAFAEEAVIGYFGEAVVPTPMPPFAAVCAPVGHGSAAAGMLSLENSLSGTVGDAIDTLAGGSVHVVGER